MTVGSLEWWRTFNIMFVACGQTLFVGFYLTLPWWRTFLGRALFVKAVFFGSLVDAIVIGRIWDWELEDATFILLYGLAGVGTWLQLAAFIRQGRNRHQPLDDSDNIKEPEHDHETA